MSSPYLIANELIRILLYFDVFSYPLTRRELISYIGTKPRDRLQVSNILDDLEKSGVIGHFAGLFFIGKDRLKVNRRIKGNSMAATRLKTARKYSRIISYFPFVRGIFISGSLSKGFASEKDDIDYFIITRPGRLWITRTFLILFKKIFLFNSYRNFCINFLVDEDHLFIKEHNRYTATEIVFLVPVFNKAMYEKLLIKNSWVKKYYPDFRQKHDFCLENNPVSKKWMEKILSYSLGDYLELQFFRRSRSYIRKKYSYMDEDCFARSFSLLGYELRFFPGGQQQRILKMYREKVEEFKLSETGPSVYKKMPGKSDYISNKTAESKV